MLMLMIVGTSMMKGTATKMGVYDVNDVDDISGKCGVADGVNNGEKTS